jgi:hypothetical protein
LLIITVSLLITYSVTVNNLLVIAYEVYLVLADTEVKTPCLEPIQKSLFIVPKGSHLCSKQTGGDDQLNQTQDSKARSLSDA